jgi:hypothetical protein
VNVESEERTNGMNLLEAHGCGLENVRWEFLNRISEQNLSKPNDAIFGQMDKGVLLLI